MLEQILPAILKESPLLFLLVYVLSTTNRKLDMLVKLEMYKLGERGELAKAREFVKNGNEIKEAI